MELLVLVIIGTFVTISMVSNSTNKKVEKAKKAVDLINQNKIRDYLRENEMSNCKKFISRDYSNAIIFDEKSNEIVLITKKSKKKSDGSIEYNFDKINANKLMESEVVVDNQPIYKTVRSSQLLGATIGGVTLGTAGMVVGALSGNKIKHENIKSVDLKILVEDVNSPNYKISFLPNNSIHKNGYPKDSSEAKASLSNVEKWHGIMEVLIRQQNKVTDS